MRQVGQLVVSNANLAQQLATGKAQLATINGQQVLIRTAQGSGGSAATGSNVILKTAQQQPQSAAVKVIKSTASCAGGSAANQLTPTKIDQTSQVKAPTTPTKSTSVSNLVSATSSATNSASNIMQVRTTTFYLIYKYLN